MMENDASLELSQQLFAEVLDGNVDDQEFISVINPNPSIDGQVAIDIYRNNSIGTRKKTLEAIYRVVERILGEQCFNGLAYEFVTTSPSSDPDLNVYGEGFPDFLRTIVWQQGAFKGFPYLPDLACLEWIVHATYYSGDDPLFSVADFSAIDTSVHLLQSHSMHTISTTYPVYAIWQGNQGDERVEEVAAVADGNEFILIRRQHGHPRVEKICSEDWRIIQLVEDGIELETLAAIAVDQGLELQTRLPAMIERGWIIFYQGT